MPPNTSFLFSSVHAAPLHSPLQIPSPSPVWLQPGWTKKLETLGVLILIISYLQSYVVWGNSFQELYVKLPSFSFVPRDFFPVYVSNLEDEKRNTKKRDKYKGKALSLPLPFLQLLTWECPRACRVHVLGFDLGLCLRSKRSSTCAHTCLAFSLLR